MPGQRHEPPAQRSLRARDVSADSGRLIALALTPAAASVIAGVAALVA